MNTKRVIIATIMGAICGIICCQLASSNNQLAWSLTASIFFSRVLLGFGIGISNWKMSWWLHGIIMGIIFSIPGAFGGLSSPDQAVFIFVGTIGMGVIYGVVIELVTSILFKASQA